MVLISCLKKHNSSQQLLDQETLEITLILSQQLITGLMKTEFRTNIKLIFVELRYMLNAAVYAGLINFTRLYAIGFIGRFYRWTRYDRNTYMEVEISELPPREVLQIVWNGTPVFVRRLTAQEVHQENH